MVEDLWQRSKVQAPHYANRSLVFEWRRIEGQTHYPPHLEGCDWSKKQAIDGFLGYFFLKKREVMLQWYLINTYFPFAVLVIIKPIDYCHES